MIALDKHKTLQSVERDKYIDLQVERTGRKLPYPMFRDTLDQYDLFRKELYDCGRYRLITTIRPYCTNVLFNPLTEVLDKNTGKVWNWKDSNFHRDFIWTTKKTGVPSADSPETYQYSYNLGSDVFSNHLLRNISFKAVNNGGSDETFNTMNDAHRDRYGRKVDDNLYEFGDCMPFIVDPSSDEMYNCMDYEMRNIDGWYGFNNKANIQTSSNRDYTHKEKNCSSVINSVIGGKFVQLYPTKEEFLFNPVYNELKDRVEYNWDVCLTYPYKNYTDNQLVQDGEWNGLLVKSVKSDGVFTVNGRRGFLISTYIPHNLELGDKFTLSYKKDGVVVDPYNENGVYLSVMKLGDIQGKNKEYAFMVSEDEIRNGYDKLMYGDDGFIGDALVNSYNFRLRKLRRKVESVYYFRIFRKLPNFKYAKHYLDLPTVKDEERLNGYLTDIENVRDGFDYEMYQLGFSQTVYNDNNSQITFTDSIESDILTDNLGRPVSEFYTTIIKSNRGCREWYEGGNANDDKVEVSHCFGEVSMGILCEEKYTSSMVGDDIEKKCDVRFIDDSKDAANVRVNGLSFTCDGEEFDTVGLGDRYFLGDIVEFNHDMAKEYVLTNVHYRFNTWQRENITDFDLAYEDIDEENVYKVKTVKVGKHKEGYYYQPHYRVQIKEFGDIKEGEHMPLSISRVNRYDRKGDNDKSAVASDNHNCYLFRLFNRQSLNKGDVIRIRIGDIFYKMNIIYAPNSMSFVVDVTKAKFSPLKNNVIWNDVDEEQINILKEYFQDKTVVWGDNRYIWRENPNIPWYAIRHPLKENRYVWRVMYGYGDVNCKELDDSVVFANGHIYLNQYIDFFLRRQDPYGYYGKLYNGDVSDVVGDKMKEPPTRMTHSMALFVKGKHTFSCAFYFFCTI